MDLSLKEASDKFENVMRDLIKSTEQELLDVNKRIDELNELLQTKEMFVDRSENASFQIATDERDVKVTVRSLLQKRIATFEAGIGNYTPTGFITQGSTVELTVMTIADKKPANMQTNFVVKLVDHALSKADIGLVAVDSKVGAALLSHRAGDIIEVFAPKGLIRYRIERLY